MPASQKADCPLLTGLCSCTRERLHRVELASFFLSANYCNSRDDFPEMGEKGQQPVPYNLQDRQSAGRRSARLLQETPKHG